MSDLDYFGCENPNYVGFDYMSLLKGTGGLLQSFGGSGGGGGEKGPSAAQMQQQMQLQQAEQSAATMKIVLIGLVALLGAGGLALALRR
jgi:hypothetical protein